MGRNERDRLALCSGTPRAADAVDVVGHRRRQVVVIDVGHALDVESARRNVRRAEDLQFCTAELAQDETALRLREVAAERVDEIAALCELHHERTGALLRGAEHHGKIRCLLVDGGTEAIELVPCTDGNDDLLDGSEGHCLSRETDVRGVGHEPLCQAHNALGHRCREECELIVLCHSAEQGLHILDEAHLQHLIRLVEDDLVYTAERKRSAPYVIEQTSRRTDDELRTAAQLFLLALDIRPAIDHNGANTKGLGERFGDALDLDGELARRCDDECLRRRALRLDAHKERQEISECLARPRLRLCDYVAPRAHGRDRLLLHGGRLCDALFLEECGQCLRDAELVEMRHDESTSAPVSVMRMVFSHCAESVPSFVRTVHPSVRSTVTS